MRRTFNKKLCVSSWDQTKNEPKKPKRTPLKPLSNEGMKWFSLWFKSYLEKVSIEQKISIKKAISDLSKKSGLSIGAIETWAYRPRHPNLIQCFILVETLSKETNRTEAHILKTIYNQWKHAIKEEEND